VSDRRYRTMLYESIGEKPHEWAGKTAGEVQSIGQQDGSVLVVPVGSIEQHGNHLPVATDTILVEAIVDAALGRLDDEPVLVTPTVWSGFSPHHLGFGGTLTLEFDHMRSALEDIAHTGLQNGFDAIIFVNGHGGNIAMISTVTSTVGVDADAEVLGLTYFQLATEEIQNLRDSDTGGMAHGGEFETSLMLAVRPDLVAEGGWDATMWDEHYEWGGSDLVEGGPLSVYRPFEAYSDTGAIGAPAEASAKKGERIREIIGTELAAVFVAIHEANRN
jgi:creatinine amidohydrolase